jgi:hypothetical protein
MTIQNVIDLLSAIGGIVTPIVLLWLSAVGWALKKRIETNYERERYLRELEEKLRDDRINAYNAVLEPFLLILLSTNIKLPDKPIYQNKTAVQVAQDIMLSLEHRQISFKLSLIGSDEVVRAYNELMQYAYNISVDNPVNTKILMKLLGNFLIEIRKSMGNVKTQLDYIEMLEGTFKDIRTLRD